METYHADIFFSSRLLRFDKSSGTIDADNETSSDFGVEGPGMSCFFDTEDAFDPGDDFVGGWVGGFVEIDDTV